MVTGLWFPNYFCTAVDGANVIGKLFVHIPANRVQVGICSVVVNFHSGQICLYICVRRLSMRSLFTGCYM